MIDEKMISVIIPFYSKREYLIEAVRSVTNQIYENFEIVLIDDGSKEDVKDIVSRYPKLRYFRQENQGAAVARNYGIDMALGDYIAFLDADDIWEPAKLRTQIQYMTETSYKWSHTAYSTFTNETELHAKKMEDFNGMVFPKCLAINPIATPCVMIEAEILRNNPHYRFKAGMKSGEDSYLWTLLAMDYELGFINRSLTKVRMRGTNSALLVWHQLRARAEMWMHFKNDQIFDMKSVRIPIRFAYNLCTIGYKILRRHSRWRDTSFMIEITSKILYIIPWVIFKAFK